LADKDALNPAFAGNLGDGVQRSYASAFIYNSRSQVTQELFGTQTPLYHKLQYNIRGQLWDVRVSTGADVNGSMNRGGFQFFYDSSLGYGTSGPDNNGNVRFANTYSPEDEQDMHWAIHRQSYEYDPLNRLKSVTEYYVNYAQAESQTGVQTYNYDRWGNRTIVAPTSGAGINNTPFEIEAARNRLYSPGDTGLPENQKRIVYDKAGNQTKDTYTGHGSAGFDADNRITAIQDSYAGWSYYTYNADGQRVRRQSNNQETWQIYGIEGELVAVYAANAAVSSPQKEYGYRNGQLLITAQSGASGSGTTTNVASAANGATASASSTWGGQVLAPTTINGDHVGSNGWWADNTSLGYPDWLEVDFAGAKTINEIDVFGVQQNYSSPVEPTLTMTSGYALTDFEVQYWNGSGWAAVPGGTVTGNDKVWRRFTFAPLTTSKIRVNVTNVAGDNHSNIVEVEAWTATSEGSSSATINWLVTDQLGTPRMILDQTGSLANVRRHDYLPFGEELFAGSGGRSAAQGYSGGDGVRQQFTQKERDVETGLDYFLARYYSSAQGRFTSPDEFKRGPDEVFVLGGGHPEKQALVYADVTNPQSLNKYQYTFNNPLRYVDPGGQNPQDSFELNFSRDVKDLVEKRITEEQFRSRMNARGVGAAVGAAIVAAYAFGPTVATAILIWATRNPEKAEQLANEAVQASSGNPISIPEARAVNLGRKLEYILGNATGKLHNIERSTAMAAELGRIGLRDTAETRALVTDHLTKVAQTPGVAQANGNVVRESLLMGPGGAVKLKTIWKETKDQIKLITIEVLRPK
jgi:RHS repeat-associated protein